MSVDQYSSTPPNTNENKVVISNEDQSKVISSNDNQQVTISSNSSSSSVVNANSDQDILGKTDKNEKKSKRSKKDENVLFMTIEEEDEPIHIKMKRIIPKIIDEYVTTYKKPIRRKKLQDLVFGYDEKLSRFYGEQREAAVAVFSFALTKLLKEKKIIRVKDPEKKRPTYYILPKHVQLFKKEE
ncbi:hypothetical protein [Saccharolobus caldissimus]|uniref:Uncharacterized protein n=1 Tax=Saccharolobus caldissimus TaxID=1702097 RepID=A0AAQ4CNS4_9CREN|nr:hypothetical protein [Saccharolobus caldissimus]BDB97455.1 hypothetical protein SACC_04720 [Saccharolobus caldissimus]